MHRHVADLRQAFCAPGEALPRLGVVAGVVSNGLLGIRPGVLLAPVYDECVHDLVGAVRLDRRITPEASDLHAFPFFLQVSPYSFCHRRLSVKTALESTPLGASMRRWPRPRWASTDWRPPPPAPTHRVTPRSYG